MRCGRNCPFTFVVYLRAQTVPLRLSELGSYLLVLQFPTVRFHSTWLRDIARTTLKTSTENRQIVKVTLVSFFAVNGELLIIRSCAWASDSRNDDGPCAINTPAHIRIEHCSTCDHDLCNGVAAVGGAVFLSAVLAAAVKLVTSVAFQWISFAFCYLKLKSSSSIPYDRSPFQTCARRAS